MDAAEPVRYLGLHPYDLIVLVAYLIGIAAIGIWVARRVRDTGHYFMGGRGFGKLLMIGQAFGVGTHAEQPVATAGASFHFGLSGIWYQWKFIFCTPFYWMIAPIFRRLRYVTSAEYMEARYGTGAGILYTVFALAFFMMNQSGMLNGAAKVVAQASGGVIPHTTVIYAMTTVFVAYSFFGGLVSAAVTDFLQSFLIITLSVMLVPFGLKAIGGFSELHAVLGSERLGLSAPQGISVGLILILSAQSLCATFAQPHHMAAVGTGKTEFNCRVGFTYGNFIKRFCTLGWAVVGLIVAVMVAKGLAQPDGADPEFAFGLACRKLLSPGWAGLMIACILASNMSACSAFMVDVGALFVQNIYRRFLRPGMPDAHYLWAGRISGASITIGAVGLTFVMPSVLNTILNSESLASFMGISYAAGLFWRRANRTGAIASFLVATVVFYTLGHMLHHDTNWHGDSFIIALASGIVSMVAGSFLGRPEPDEVWNNLQRRLHLPTSAEDAPEAERDQRAAEAENAGAGLLVVDLLRLPKTFSFKRYRIDLIGFVSAFSVVGVLILCALAIGWLG